MGSLGQTSGQRGPCTGGRMTCLVRAESDPALFQSERVLRGLREGARQCGGLEDYWKKGRQPLLRVEMRREVASWLMSVCEEESCPPSVFCLSVMCLDSFLCRVSCLPLSQLQSLATACLLIAWKVREHRAPTSHKLIKTPGLSFSISQTRAKTQELIFSCYVNHKLALYQPGVIAAACVLFSLRPLLQMPPPRPDTPMSSSIESLESLSSSPILNTSPSCSTSSSSICNYSISPNCSLSSPSCSSSSPLPQTSPPNSISPFRTPESPIPIKPEANRRSPKSPDLDKITRSVQKITLVPKPVLQKCLEELEEEVNASLIPPTPSPSLSEENLCGLSYENIPSQENPSNPSRPPPSTSPLPQAAKTLFPSNLKTPTKLLDVTDCS